MTRTLLLLIFMAGALQTQSPESKQAQADRIFGAFNTHTPGCAVGVESHGVVVLKSGYGMADLERNVPITTDTVFESGSVAKQFTAAFCCSPSMARFRSTIQCASTFRRFPTTGLH